MLRWSLRTKLVCVTVLALLPLLALVGWRTAVELEFERTARDDAAVASLDLVSARFQQAMDGSRRLLIATCAAADVRRSVEPAASPDDLARCESYLFGVMANFGQQYSATVVTGDDGLVRCSSVRTAAGMKLGDREVFTSSRDRDGVFVGRAMASRLTAKTVIPLATGIRQAGRFGGMCAIGLSLKTLAETLIAPAASPGSLPVMLVDNSGTSIAATAQSALTLPMAQQLERAMAPGRSAFSERGQNGVDYRYRMVPLPDIGLYAVVAVPAGDGVMSSWRHWLPLVYAALASAVVLLVVWIGADRWCVRPLLQLERAASRIARGEEAKSADLPGASPELVAVSRGVEAMATAIASREAELRQGLEQRDHMLREIHHRVKNNLQMISSLLNLQASEIRSPRIRRYFGDAQNRVLTLSILHRHLYERSSWSLVDFQQFISDLVRQISVGRSSPERVLPRYQIRAPIMAVGPDTAIPVGLIVTEAVSSALNHQYAGVATPEIRIEAIEKEGQVELVIEDNGRRTVSDVIGPEVRTSFGFTLLKGLAMQLGGEATIGPTPTGGTRVVVNFPMPEEIGPDA